jgi:hypothetical protein
MKKLHQENEERKRVIEQMRQQGGRSENVRMMCFIFRTSEGLSPFNFSFLIRPILQSSSLLISALRPWLWFRTLPLRPKTSLTQCLV